MIVTGQVWSKMEMIEIGVNEQKRFLENSKPDWCLP